MRVIAGRDALFSAFCADTKDGSMNTKAVKMMKVLLVIRFRVVMGLEGGVLLRL